MASKIGKEQVVLHDTSTLGGKELDIFVPSLNLAIEYNGLRWHSSLFKHDTNYHLSKTLQCAEKGIFLMQFFEDESIDKVKDHISLVLKLSEEFLRDKTISCLSELKYGITKSQNTLVVDRRLINHEWFRGYVVEKILPPVKWSTDSKKRWLGDGEFFIYDCGSVVLKKEKTL